MNFSVVVVTNTVQEEESFEVSFAYSGYIKPQREFLVANNCANACR